MDAASPDAARDRPGSLGGQYEKLLATVGNLQGDLQRTVGVCQVWFTLVARVVHGALPTHANRTCGGFKICLENGSVVYLVSRTACSILPGTCTIKRVAVISPVSVHRASDTDTEGLRLDFA